MQDDYSSVDAGIKEAVDIEPRWVTATLRFLPAPIFAFTVAAVFLALACFFYLLGSADRSPTGLVISGFFASLSMLIGTANLNRSLRRGRAGALTSRYKGADSKPTLVIFVLIIWVYSWMLMLGLRVFRIFFAAKAGAGTKYYLTLSIAIASSIYLAVHGRSVLRRHIGPRGARNLVVTPRQALMVVLVVLAFGGYFAWLIA
jgi:hypothetical protein